MFRFHSNIYPKEELISEALLSHLFETVYSNVDKVSSIKWNPLFSTTLKTVFEHPDLHSETFEKKMKISIEMINASLISLYISPSSISNMEDEDSGSTLPVIFQSMFRNRNSLLIVICRMIMPDNGKINPKEMKKINDLQTRQEKALWFPAHNQSVDVHINPMKEVNKSGPIDIHENATPTRSKSELKPLKKKSTKTGSNIVEQETRKMRQKTSRKKIQIDSDEDIMDDKNSEMESNVESNSTVWNKLKSLFSKSKTSSSSNSLKSSPSSMRDPVKPKEKSRKLKPKKSIIDLRRRFYKKK